MAKAVLVLEISASDIRSNAVDLDSGKILCTVTKKTACKNTGIGKFEIDADLLWKNLQETLGGVLEFCGKEHEFKAVTFSSAGDTLIPVDADLKPLRNLILPFDTRAQEEAQELTYLMGEKNFRSITGGSCLPSHTCAKIMWLKHREPRIFKSSRYFLSVSEYLFCKMGFGVYTDFTQACAKKLFHRIQRRWSLEIASCLDMDPSQAGETVQDSSFILGKVKNIGKIEFPYEIPVVLGLHDKEAALLGTGVSPNHSKIIGDFTGSSETVGCFSPDQVLSLAFSPSELGGSVRGDSSSVSSTCNSQLYISWFRDKIYKGNGDVFADLEEKTHFDASSHVSFITRGDAADCAVTGFDTSMDSHMIYQAILEGITFQLKEALDSIEKTLGTPCRAVYCAGGIVSPKWLQLKADLFKREVRQITNHRVSAVGAAILAAVSIGYYKTYEEAFTNMIQFTDVFVPNPAISAAYQERFINYCRECRKYYQYI